MYDPLLGEKIKKLQENSSHTGKHPKIQPRSQAAAEVTKKGELEFSPEEQIKQLKRRLEVALQEEDYETAAACRDKIHSLEGEMRHDEMV